MDIPSVAREHKPGSCRNSCKPLRHYTLCELRPDSTALCPEQLRFPNQTRKEPRFAWLNSRESPTTLSQDMKNTDVTPGMQNCSVCPKSNWDEANFPCIGSITTPRSTSYRTSHHWESPSVWLRTIQSYSFTVLKSRMCQKGCVFSGGSRRKSICSISGFQRPPAFLGSWPHHPSLKPGW